MGDGPRSVRLVGARALLSGVVSAAIVAFDGAGRFGGALTGGQPTIYGPAQAALTLVLALGGLLLLAVRARVVATALLSIIGLCAAQLAGTGLVGFRRWPLFWGCCSRETVTEQDLVRTLALVMAGLCAVTAIACVNALVSAHHVRWREGDLTMVVAFAVALIVAIAGPRLVVGSWDDDVKGLAAWALMSGFPFAAALALSGLMQRFAAIVTTSAVASLALLATVGESYFELNQPWGDAQLLVVVAALVVAATRLSPLPQCASELR